MFKKIDNAQALPVMLESPGMELVETELAGMAKGCMPQVMTQGNRLSQIFVEPKTDRHGPCDLRHLKHMGQPCPIMVSGRGEKNLGFMFQPPEGFGMDDPVPVALKSGPQIARFWFAGKPSPGLAAQAGIGGQGPPFLFFKLFPDCQRHDRQCRLPSGCQSRYALMKVSRRPSSTASTLPSSVLVR